MIAPDGTAIAIHETGVGRPFVLLHGFFSDAATNWLKYGHAAALAAAGFRVIMPDLRGHGSSGKPHEAGAYPPDVLVDDALAVIEQLGSPISTSVAIRWAGERCCGCWYAAAARAARSCRAWGCAAWSTRARAPHISVIS